MNHVRILLICLIVGHPAFAQVSAQVAPPTRAPLASVDTSTADHENPGNAGIQIEVEARLANVYESNIDHSSESVSSVGLVPAVHIRLLDRPQETRFRLDYVLSQHTYSNTDEWDRTSHLIGLGYEVEPTDGVTSATEAEVSIRGTSEDRDLANQYAISQTLEAKLSRMHRLEVFGALRYKIIPDDPVGPAFKPKVGVGYEQRWPSGLRWGVGGRWETNRERVERGNYNQATLSAELQVPAFGSPGFVEIDLKRKVRTYTIRLAEDEDGDATDQLRQDVKWTAGLTWHVNLLRQVGFELGVEVERRTSNDPDKPYTASSLVLGLSYRF